MQLRSCFGGSDCNSTGKDARRAEKEIGEKLAEKRGWHWALTGFAFESWGDSERDLGEIVEDGHGKNGNISNR